MSTLTLTAASLAGLAMIEIPAHQLHTGDLITLSGSWVRVAADAFIENEARGAETIVIVAPLTNPGAMRTWATLATARVAALRDTVTQDPS